MSMIVKGMKMPESCYKCPLLIYNSETEDCRCALCFRVRGVADNKEKWSQVDSDCPLGEVPTPHGRLIDADALKDYMIDGLNDTLHEVQFEKRRKALRDITLAFIQDIDECPTIIEEEVEA